MLLEALCRAGGVEKEAGAPFQLVCSHLLSPHPSCAALRAGPRVCQGVCPRGECRRLNARDSDWEEETTGDNDSEAEDTPGYLDLLLGKEASEGVDRGPAAGGLVWRERRRECTLDVNSNPSRELPGEALSAATAASSGVSPSLLAADASAPMSNSIVTSSGCPALHEPEHERRVSVIFILQLDVCARVQKERYHVCIAALRRHVQNAPPILRITGAQVCIPATWGHLSVHRLHHAVIVINTTTTFPPSSSRFPAEAARAPRAGGFGTRTRRHTAVRDLAVLLWLAVVRLHAAATDGCSSSNPARECAQ